MTDAGNLDYYASYGLGVLVLVVAVWWLSRRYLEERKAKDAILKEAIQGLHLVKEVLAAVESVRSERNSQHMEVLSELRHIHKEIHKSLETIE